MHSTGDTPTSRAAHATWWSTLEITARYGVQLGVIVALARLLEPDDFGLIAMLLVVTSVGTLLVDGGFSTALIQKQSTSDDDETTVFVFALAAGTSVAAILWIGAPWIAAFYHQPPLRELTRLMVLVLPLGSLASVPDALLTQRLAFRLRAKAEIVASLFSGALAVTLAWMDFGAWSLAWQAVSGALIRAVMLWRYARWHPRGRFSTQSFSALAGFGGYMLLANLLNTLSVRLQSLMIGRLFDSSALGYYALAQNTQEAPASFVSGILNRVGLPVFASVADQPTKLVGALRLSLQIATFLFLPCMLGIAAIAKPLIMFMYGARWEPAAPLLSILAASAAFWPMHVLNLAAIGAQGRSNLILRLEVIKRLVSITLILACSAGGAIGVAWAVLASSIFSLFANTWYAGNLFGYGLRAQLQDQASTSLLAVASTSMAWGIVHWSGSGFSSAALAVLIAATTYLAGAAALRHPALSNIRELYRTLRSNIYRDRKSPTS